MSKTLIATVLLVTSLSSVTKAGEFGFKTTSHAHQGWPHLIAKYCCDDYVPKCIPSVKQVCRFTCDDYLSKCAPCVKPFCGYVCDDYCPKSPPVLPCPRKDYLRCPQPTKSQSSTKVVN
jgi:hypothetical protein